MSRAVPFIPVTRLDDGTPAVLVDNGTTIPRCDCCPEGCVFCDEEERPLIIFTDRSRLIDDDGTVIADAGEVGRFEPVGCTDNENPFPPVAIGEVQVPAPATLIPDRLLFDDDARCGLTRESLPNVEGPFGICREYFWRDDADPAIPETDRFWIAAIEVFAGIPFVEGAVALGWYVLQRFEFGGRSTVPVWGFTSDVDWPFTGSDITLLGCEVSGPGPHFEVTLRRIGVAAPRIRIPGGVV